MPSGDEQQPETSEEESLQRLKRIRRGNRSKITKLINEAYEFMQQHPSPNELDPEITWLGESRFIRSGRLAFI